MKGFLSRAHYMLGRVIASFGLGPVQAFIDCPVVSVRAAGDTLAVVVVETEALAATRASADAAVAAQAGCQS